MRTLEKGHDKIKKISDQLIKEALEPARNEAKALLEEAHAKAAEIVAEGQKQAHKLVAEAKTSIEQERNVFHSALTQASKQSIEALRQSVENTLFNSHLQQSLSAQLVDPQVIAKFINAIVEAIEKEGISGDLAAYIPKSVSVQDVNRFLVDGIIQKLQGKSVKLGDLTGGAEVKVLDKNLTIDISDESLRELMSRYVRKDFRKLLFGTT